MKMDVFKQRMNFVLKKVGVFAIVLGLGASSAFAQESCGDSCCDADSCFANKGKSWCSLFSCKKGCGDSCATGCTEEGCTSGCGDSCGLGCSSSCLGGELGEPFKLFDFGDDSDITMGGWMQFGYTSKTTTLFNNQPHRLNAHQVWLYAEKVADGSNGVGFGFRADIMYGTDAGDTQAFGSDAGEWDYLNGFDRGAGYGWAIPQLYGEIAYEDISVKVGHFYTLLGYEVVTAPDNFFYSHAFTMYNSEAFTHTGALATVSASDDMEVYAGWTLGWDTGFDQNSNGNNFLGGFSYSLSDDLTFTYITTFGNLGAIGTGYSHSMVLDWAVSDKVNYVIQSDLMDHKANSDTGAAEVETVGVNQYLFYTHSERIKSGFRYEWWKNNGKSYHAATYGINVRPMANLVVRPEIRWQTASDPGLATTTADKDELIFGCDAILTF